MGETEGQEIRSEKDFKLCTISEIVHQGGVMSSKLDLTMVLKIAGSMRILKKSLLKSYKP